MLPRVEPALPGGVLGDPRRLRTLGNRCEFGVEGQNKTARTFEAPRPALEPL